LKQRACERSKLKFAEVKMDIEMVYIDEEIKVIGLSFKKLGLSYDEANILEKMWDIYGEKYRHKVNDAIMPFVDYGINICVPAKNEDEYIAGCAVTKIGDLDEDWISFTIARGTYMKISCNNINNMSELFEVIKENWAEENGIKIDSSIMIEVYPDGAFEGKDVEVSIMCPILTNIGST
jgi:predicted transcriptional regulator YdeE